MPLPLTVSCFSKIQIGFTFLVPAHPVSPGKRADERVCVYVRVSCCNGISATSIKDVIDFISLLHRKLMSDEVLVWLSVWSEVQVVCIWSSRCHCNPQTPSSLASFKSRLVLAFRCWLTQVVLEKRPLNGCSSSSYVLKADSSRQADALIS